MLLAIETSDRLCAACLLDGATGSIAASMTLDIERGHAERLMGMIQDVLNEAGIGYADLSGIAVCVGPGSFTGIRVALATATGLSIALKIPVLGVTALQALASQAQSLARGRPILAVIDAHRGDVYVQQFTAEALPEKQPRQVSVMEAAAMPSAHGSLWCGAGAGLIAAIAASPLQIAESVRLPSVDAVALATLHPAMTVAPKPLYLRKPDAKPQESYTQARALRS